MKKALALFFCTFYISVLFAQDINFQNISSIKAENLTTSQVKDFVDKYTLEGYTLEQVENQAVQSGMPVNEWNKLKSRIQSINQQEKAEGYSSDISRNIPPAEQTIAQAEATSNEKQIYGSSLFNTSNLTFEPNLRLPTPEDYQLGPDDELVIDIFGRSENTTRATVSPEGVIKLPSVGQVNVNGLTILQAKRLITSKLSSIYSTINTGETSVSVTLGNIRSIKVMIVGEAFRPGTYTLPSVSSVFNALNACGGPNRNGSFREIKVIRNNKTISTVDIYDFLLAGELKGNVRLQDQDVIKIEPYDKRIELSGELKNTGYFEAKENETFSNMLQYAGGFTTNAYKDKVSVFRNTEKEKRVENVSYNDFGSFTVKDGDIFIVDALLNRFENRVQIEGAVFRPGTYAITPALTLKQLIEKADGLREDAFMHRGTITREKDNKETEIISFNVNDIIEGNTDILLKKEDKVFIASAIEMQEVKKTWIYGEVKNEGEYPFHENMTLQDLILAAGGTKENAELRDIEIYRRVSDPEILKSGKEVSREFKFTVDKELKGLEFKLESHDQVIIRPVSGLTNIKKVMIEGEVMYPGNYILVSRVEKISDVIKRAGGLTNYAYPEGAFMIRKIQTTLPDDKLEMKLLENTVVDEELIDKEKFTDNEGIVGINLEEIIKKSGSKYDLLLEDGDIIKVPRELQTVQVSGEVLLPSYVRFDKTNSFKDYINGSGGFSSKSLKRKSYIVYANGTSRATKSFLGIRNYPKVTPGARIYVPTKPERKSTITVGEGVALSSSIITTAALIISLINNAK